MIIQEHMEFIIFTCLHLCLMGDFFFLSVNDFNWLKRGMMKKTYLFKKQMCLDAVIHISLMHNILDLGTCL
jgi:hypothetical protein